MEGRLSSGEFVKPVEWPSVELPGPAPVRLGVLDGWLVELAPNVSFIAVSPGETEGIRANIVVSVRRIDSGISLAQVTDLVGDQLADIPGAQDVGVDDVDLGGVAATLRRFTIVDTTTGSSVEQSQLVCRAELSELVADVVTATLTYATSSTSDAVKQMEASLLSLRFG